MPLLCPPPRPSFPHLLISKSLSSEPPGVGQQPRRSALRLSRVWPTSPKAPGPRGSPGTRIQPPPSVLRVCGRDRHTEDPELGSLAVRLCAPWLPLRDPEGRPAGPPHPTGEGSGQPPGYRGARDCLCQVALCGKTFGSCPRRPGAGKQRLGEQRLCWAVSRPQGSGSLWPGCDQANPLAPSLPELFPDPQPCPKVRR